MTDDDRIERRLRRYRATGPPASLESRILAAADAEFEKRQGSPGESRAPRQRRGSFPWLGLAFPAAAAVLLVATLSLVLAADRLTARASARMVFEPAPSQAETDRLIEEVFGPGPSAVLRWRRIMMSSAPQPPPDLRLVPGTEDDR